jgi:hypothetical protein
VVAVVLLCAALVVPAGATAAPANDAFANRQVLAGPLPIEATGSNVGATSEPAEPTNGTLGHSVWFEWVAPATGWFTVGVCDSDFAAAVGVFTGTEPATLTRVASGGEGPACGSKSQFTFRASSGTAYMVQVDGALIAPPTGPPPPSEGTFNLQVEATTPPLNDNFASATPLGGEVSEEPGGNRFFSLFSHGYNWTASTEPGEFPYGAGSGASVWYRWTPPETAKYRFSGPCGGNLNLAVFSGGFGPEDEMLAASCPAEVELAGGTTYWISIYGTPDAKTGEPSMGAFQLFITAELPALPAAPQPSGTAVPSNPSRDTTEPETKIDKTSLRAATRSAKFWFSASEPVQGFLCRLDRGDYKPCRSPRTFKRLKPGRHVFLVKAIDLAGNVDGSAALARFAVPRRRKRR